MDLDDKKFEFSANGTEYRVEIWKGGYGDGGAFGGEIGIYTRGTGERGLLGNLLETIPGYYSAAGDKNQVKMTNEIYNKDDGKPYFRNDGAGADDGKHYWNLAIRTDPGVRHEDIGQRGTIEMNDPVAAQALADEMAEQGKEMAAEGKGTLTATVNGNTVSFVWE